MRIFVDARPINEPQPSGVSVYAASCVRSLLQEYPHHTFVLYLSGMAKECATITSLRTFANAHVVHKRIPNKFLHAAFLFLRWPSFERLVGKCDCYFFPNAAFIPRMPHPSVLTLHDMSFMHYRTLFPMGMRIWHRLVAPERMLTDADGIIAVSRATEIHFKEMHTIRQPKKITTIFSTTSKNKIRTQSQPYFVFIGNIEERKNIAGLILAWKMVQSQTQAPHRLLLIGKRGYLSSATKKLLKNSVTEGQIEEFGYVEEMKKNELLDNAAALVFPSVYEGYGFPIVEAIARGIPVVTSAKASMPEVAGEKSICVDPFDVSSIAEGMRTAIVASINTRADESPRSWIDVAHETMSFLENIAHAYAHRN